MHGQDPEQTSAVVPGDANLLICYPSVRVLRGAAVETPNGTKIIGNNNITVGDNDGSGI